MATSITTAKAPSASKKPETPIEVLAIERVFARLLAVYGAQFTRMWQDAEPEAVQSAWCAELGNYLTDRGRMECVVWALENLPERCPNAIEFRNLCRNAPQSKPVAYLTEPRPSRESLAVGIAMASAMKKRIQARMCQQAATTWHQSIINDASAGKRIAGTTLRAALEAQQVRQSRLGATAIGQQSESDAPKATHQSATFSEQ